jgi:predicted nucleic acid-binding protein
MRPMAGASAFFVDTNVLLYSVDPAGRDKQAAARQWITLLWEHSAGRLSWQVLNEFYLNAVRKLGAPTRNARMVVEALVQWKPVDMTPGILRRAWHWMDTAQLAYWDALILAAAERAECAWMLSEDFQAGRRYGSVTVINPFREQPESFGLEQARRG